MALGEQIRQARLRAGLTQQGLARALGLSNRLVSHWELGVRTPRPVHLQQIADLTFTEPEALLSPDHRFVHEEPPSSPEELLMLRQFRRMSQRQQQNLLKLLGVSGDVRGEIEHQSEPAAA